MISILDDFYDVRKTLKMYPDADIYMVIGKRSNGKTYSVLDYVLERYALYGEQFAYIRRFNEEIRPKWVDELFTWHVKNGRFVYWFSKTDGPMWNSTVTKSNRIYCQKITYSDGKKQVEKDEKPIGYCLSLNTWEHSKGITLPGVQTILFDEFLSREGYLPDEVNTFQQLLSSIIRSKDDVKVFMLANTVNVTSPYFTELGLYHIGEMEPGTIQQYKAADNTGEYIVEYTNARGKGGKGSDKYFNIFDNESSRMITTGQWETSTYPRLPFSAKNAEEVAKAYFMYARDVALCRVLLYNNDVVAFFEPRNARRMFEDVDYHILKKQFRDIVLYADYPFIGAGKHVAITREQDNLSKLIINCLKRGKACYSSNTVGELIRNYLMWATQFSPISK